MTIEKTRTARVDSVPAHSALGVTRRSIMMNTTVSLASLASATIVPALAVGADDQILELERKISAATERLDETTCGVARAERAVAGWLRRNPKPKSPPWQPGEDEHAVMTCYAETFAQWKRRKRIAEANGGYVAALAAEKVASAELRRLSVDLCQTRAKTLAYLTAKARAARAAVCSDGDMLAWSVVEDILDAA